MRPGELDRSTLSEPAVRLLALWESKRRGGRLPSEGDFNPSELTAWLPWLILLDVLSDPPDFRYRRTGQMIVATTGMDMNGRKLSEMDVPPEVLRRFMAEHLAAVDTAGPRYDLHRMVNPKRGGPVAYERLLLPLSDDGATVRSLLGMRRPIT